MRVPIVADYLVDYLSGDGRETFGVRCLLGIDLRDDVSNVTRPDEILQLLEQILLETLAGSGGTGSQRSMHVIGDVPDLNGGHGGIVALMHAECNRAQ